MLPLSDDDDDDSAAADDDERSAVSSGRAATNSMTEMDGEIAAVCARIDLEQVCAVFVIGVGLNREPRTQSEVLQELMFREIALCSRRFDMQLSELYNELEMRV
jgi:hypothetical protein